MTRVATGLVFLLPALLQVVEGVRQFSKVNLTDTDARAVCSDGAPSVTYVSLSPSAGSSSPWLIWVDGPTNPVRSSFNSSVPSSNLWPDIVGFSYGPFGSPSYAQHSMAVLMYCSSDFFLSQLGYSIMAAWMAYLTRLIGPSSSSVILGGATVGALGLVANIDLFTGLGSSGSLSLLLDSPFFTPPVTLTPAVAALIKSSPSPACALNATHVVYSEDNDLLTPCCLDFLCSSQFLPESMPVLLVQSLAYATAVNDALLVSSSQTLQYSDSQIYNLSLTTTKSGALVNSALRSAANARPGSTSFIAYSCVETPVLSPFGNAQCLQNNFLDFSVSTSAGGSVHYGCSSLVQTAAVSSGDFASSWSNSPASWRELQVNTGTKSFSVAEFVTLWTNDNQTPLTAVETCDGMNCNPSCSAFVLTLQLTPYKHISALAGLLLLAVLLLAFVALGIVYVKFFCGEKNLPVLSRNLSGLPNSSALSQSFAASRTLETEALTYWNEKNISSSSVALKHVSLSIPQGSLVGIIGGSGCGKSTLLELLAGRRDRGCYSGEIFMDRKPVSTHWLARNTGIVRQSLSPLVNALTLMQNLEFAAMLRVTGSTEFVRSRIDFVLDRLELAELKDSTTGTLSGGQRKRAEVALELLTQPAILFLDEPTSALDARTALNFMDWIAKVSQSTGSSIILSIHQPREEIWKLFDQIILLEKGFLVYSGPPFALPISVTANPADVAVELAGNRREVMMEAAREWSGNLKISNLRRKKKKKNHQADNTVLSSSVSPPPMLRQIRSFLLRLMAVHPPLKINTLRSALGLSLLSVLVSLLISAIFWSMDSESVRTKALAFLVLVPAFLSNSFVVSYVCEDMPIYLIERSNFYVTPIAFFIHHILHLVIYIILPFTVFPFAQYFLLWGRTLGGFQLDMFYQMVGFSQLCFIAFLSLFVFSCFLLRGNQSNAMIMNSSLESLFALFSGFLAPLPSLTLAPIRWLSYASPAMWGYVGVAYSIADVQFPGDCGPSTTASESTCYLSQSGNSLIYALGFNSLNPVTAFSILLAWSILFFFLSWLVLARPWHKGAMKLIPDVKDNSGIELLGKIAEKEQSIFMSSVNSLNGGECRAAPSETHFSDLNTDEENYDDTHNVEPLSRTSSKV